MSFKKYDLNGGGETGESLRRKIPERKYNGELSYSEKLKIETQRDFVRNKSKFKYLTNVLRLSNLNNLNKIYQKLQITENEVTSAVDNQRFDEFREKYKNFSVIQLFEEIKRLDEISNDEIDEIRKNYNLENDEESAKFSIERRNNYRNKVKNEFQLNIILIQKINNFDEIFNKSKEYFLENISDLKKISLNYKEFEKYFFNYLRKLNIIKLIKDFSITQDENLLKQIDYLSLQMFVSQEIAKNFIKNE